MQDQILSELIFAILALILQYYAIVKVSTVKFLSFSTAKFNSVFLHCPIKEKYQISFGGDKHFVSRRNFPG